MARELTDSDCERLAQAAGASKSQGSVYPIPKWFIGLVAFCFPALLTICGVGAKFAWDVRGDLGVVAQDVAVVKTRVDSTAGEFSRRLDTVDKRLDRHDEQIERLRGAK